MEKKKIYEELLHILVVLFSATFYSFGVICFLTPAKLFASGVTGFSQVISMIIFNISGFEIPLGVLTFLFNVPLFIYGWKKVSIRFSLYSLLSVIVQSLLMMGWIPTFTFGVNPLENQLLFALMGGLITGVANGISLRYGTSTGGIDILAQAISMEKGISIGIFTMIFNCSIAIIGGGLLSHAWEISMYTLIRIIITSLVVDKIHTSYNLIRLDIISEHMNLISDKLLQELGHGVTLMNVEGAYTHREKKDAFILITSYELAKAKKICLGIDPNVFIVIAPARGTIGRFAKKTIM